MKDYKQKIEYCFIITLLLLIALCYFFPGKNLLKSRDDLPEMNQFTIVSYPINLNIKYNRPKPQKPVIPIMGDEIDILDEYVNSEIEIDSINQLNILSIPYTKFDFVLDDGFKYSSNIIVISFKIGSDGKVKDHVLMKCSEIDSTTLMNIVNKASSQIWDRKYDNGVSVEYYRNESYLLLN